MNARNDKLKVLWAATFFALLCSCTTVPVHPPLENVLAYVVPEDEQLLSRHAPVFVIDNFKEKYNRIGTPSAKITEDSEELVYVDPAKATVYTRVDRFETSKDAYTNLVYRIHFQKVPGGFIPFYLGKGRNTGLIVLVTLNSRNEPVLYTLVHTCGCYLAFVPTSYLPADRFPDYWENGRQSVYGESLPGLLDYEDLSPDGQKTIVLVREGSHRVMDIWFSDADSLQKYHTDAMEMLPLGSLEMLLLESDRTTSFYETCGPREGYVKGSEKIRERLLMSWWALDWRVGEDKKLGKDKNDGILFYTSLKPWAREESDLRDFVTFLRYWKWKL
ncbi:hypothetical protein DSOUD_2222 [Desulfuromonas soudanensis]|uniref:Lipoprotein n=1 Tax=Desulfuromonas soudanensis TaxID=1603606 RepID=A0A0M4DIG6_9BACT|nr:hypothetical protein [Desulfuromonas soudanensis]ALC16987.1 hypothetical protein DSOUD_2222 [Desulfuromonas soudanensis]